MMNLQFFNAILSHKRGNTNEVAKRRTFLDFTVYHARHLLTEALHVFFNYDWIYWLIGLINKKLHIIESVFLVYPATEDYLLAYSYVYRSRWHQWKPGPLGFLYQNRKIGIIFGISASNGHLIDPTNKEKLLDVANRMEKIRSLFYARHKTFAGILPGVLFMNRMIRETPEADVTVRVVCQVIDRVKKLERLNENTPVIVLGGKGFIGRRVVASLPKGTVYSVDIAGNNGQNIWPSQLHGKPVLLVNISLNSALGQYIHLLWPEVVIINEVYPEPPPELAQRLKDIGCHCYHIAGVKAKVLPSFPGGYKGGIPCCAAWQSENMEALFKRIV